MKRSERRLDIVPARFLSFVQFTRVGGIVKHFRSSLIKKESRDAVGPVLFYGGGLTQAARRFPWGYMAGCTRQEAVAFLAISPIAISPLTTSASK